MKQHQNKYFFLAFFLFSLIFSVSAQRKNELWQKTADSEIKAFDKIERRTIPKAYKVYNLDMNSLKQELQNTPKRKGKSLKSSTILNFPSADGTIERYEVFEASILEESLQEKFPNIKSYIGKSLENPETTIRFSLSQIGLHAMIMQSKRGTVYIDPYTSSKESYIVYSKKDLSSIDPFECVVDEVHTASKQAITSLGAKSENANDGKLRTFRLAIATTGEYSQFQLIYNGISINATIAEKKEAVLAAINATMTRVNAIFERDVSLTMELVDNTSVIFLDPLTDGFTNDDGSILINQSQTVIDTNIGFSNYDIGHTFSTGGGGLATLNSPCTTSKAKGITGSSYPIGDAYDIDFVAHEMGHQFGANHTFNSDQGSCADGNRNNMTAIEPGSGSTIMAYAGLCTPENVQSQSDDYFHLVSIREMWANIFSGNSTCAVVSNTGNIAPTVSPLATYTLPISTPFVLGAVASDLNGDVLTYTWEQLDNEIALAPPVSTAIAGPAFRSVSPSTSSMRYFPNQETVMNGQLFNTWEMLPSVSRTMKFGVNVRDNNVNGGQTASKETVLTFDATSGPFKVTSQSSTVVWNSGDSKTITWNVANTNNAPVNCANVNILLSTDGGYTFPYILKSNVPNNGSTGVVVPNVTTGIGRIKVQSANNIFYDINDANISIQAKEFTMNFVSDHVKVCKPTSAVYNFTYNTFLGFNELTTFTAAGNPAGTTVGFNPATATANNTNVQVTVSGINNAAIGSSDISITGTSGTSSLVKNKTITVAIFDGVIASPTLTSPINNTIDFKKAYTLNWMSDVNADAYEIQIATNSDFTAIVEQATNLTTNAFSPQLLAVKTMYYWRVRSKNNCGTSSYSTVFNFTTANEICGVNNSTDTPKSIPDNNPTGVNSIINVTNNKLITDVNVTVNISHTYVQDLSLALISPGGITILLSVGNGSSGNNYSNTIFDDSAMLSISNGSAPFTGTFKPQIPLSYLNNTASYGNWTLKVVDSGEADTGTITSWSLQICGTPLISTDDDNDGVDNAIDQCPNTPIGNSVDALGCFVLPANNFQIIAVGETCPNKANGQITISPQKNYNYTTTINSTVYNFSTATTIGDLATGTYDFCIGVYVADENKTYEQCFSVFVEAGTVVIGKATILDNKVAVDIVQGTAPFEVLINGKLVMQTVSSSFSLDVNHGDFVEVKTAVECEGVFAKEIDLLKSVIAYPNPTTGLFEITLPTAQKEVKIELYGMLSQLISSKTYPILNGKVQVNIEDKSAGIYIAKVYLEKPVALKIVKH